jgi:hypothetical protein
LFLAGFFSASLFFLGEESWVVSVFDDFGLHTLLVDAVLGGNDAGGSGNNFSVPEFGNGGNGVGVASCVLGMGFRTSGAGLLLHGFAGAEAWAPVAGLLANSVGG